MDVHKLKSHIIDNPEKIELILSKSGFHNIADRGSEYRCAREDGANPTSVKVNKETLSSVCFSTNVKGDIITLVQSKLSTNFPQTIKRISDIVDFKPVEISIDTYEPFGGYYKKIRSLKDNTLSLETYSEDILDQYEDVPNLLFYKDGILPHVQMKFNIGYDSVSNRITVPWKSFDGMVAGVMGRINKRKVSEDERKWFPVIPFPKSQTLYGYVENYSAIQEKRIVLLGESEKHTLQLLSKGLDVGMSLGGSFMSEVQANHIKSLFPKTVIVLLDEGLDEDHSYDIANQLKFNKFFKNKVGYVFDKDNLYMPKGSKLAPADLDKGTLDKLIKNCTVWL